MQFPHRKGFVAFFEILWLAVEPRASQTFSQFATGISTEGTGVCTTAGGCAVTGLAGKCLTPVSQQLR